MTYLNIGCGTRYNSDWTNIDFNSCNEGVIKCNVLNGLPYPNESFSIVYHCHLIEHLRRKDAIFLIKECYRVLETRGILRVVTPDLEELTKTYLNTLEKAWDGSTEWRNNYNWISLELLDQLVRTCKSGELGEYLSQDNIPNEKFVKNRYGPSFSEFRNKRISPKHAERKNNTFLKFLKSTRSIYERLLKSMLSTRDYEALKIGRFRLKGECHLWMYDRYSLTSLLRDAGFKNIVQRSAINSYAPEWKQFNLDSDPGGVIYKPNSLYIEGIK